MQCGLVGDGAMDDRGAVALVAEAQAVKPGGPSAIEVPLEADLVASGLVTVTVDACRSLMALLVRPVLSPVDLAGAADRCLVRSRGYGRMW